MEREKVYLLYTFDNNYSMQAAVSMTSLFENNKQIDFCVYVISDGVNDENREKLIRLNALYSNEISFIEMPDLDKLSGVRIETYTWAKAAYCRMFLCSILPKSIKRILYLDPDTITVGKIDYLLQVLKGSELSDNYAAACLDYSPVLKRLCRFKRNENYINTGVMIINVQKWRDNNLQDTFIRELERRKGRSVDVDQSYINSVLINRIIVLPPEYNIVPPYYEDYQDYKNGFWKEEIYSEDEINNAITHPVIVHFSGNKAKRPWYSNGVHPMKDEWMKYFKMTDWSDEPLEKFPVPYMSNRKKVMKGVSKVISLRQITKNPVMAYLYLKLFYGHTSKLYR